MNAGGNDVVTRRLETDEDLAASLLVMRELRTDLNSVDAYLATVRRLEAEHGYRLVGAFAGDALLAVAGYRIGESLAWGRYLYVDDLVTSSSSRSRGLGSRLCAWLREEARREGCGEIHLDSGVQRHAAHRFYLRERMDLVFFHFRQTIEQP